MSSQHQTLCTDFSLLPTADFIGNYPKPITLSLLREIVFEAQSQTHTLRSRQMSLFADHKTLMAMSPTHFPKLNCNLVVTADDLDGRVYMVYQDSQGKRHALYATINREHQQSADAAQADGE